MADSDFNTLNQVLTAFSLKLVNQFGLFSQVEAIRFWLKNSVNQALNSMNAVLSSVNAVLSSVNQALSSVNQALNSVRTYAFAPLAPQIWGVPDLLPPSLGGQGGKTMVFA